MSDTQQKQTRIAFVVRLCTRSGSRLPLDRSSNSPIVLLRKHGTQAKGIHRPRLLYLQPILCEEELRPDCFHVMIERKAWKETINSSRLISSWLMENPSTFAFSIVKTSKPQFASDSPSSSSNVSSDASEMHRVYPVTVNNALKIDVGKLLHRNPAPRAHFLLRMQQLSEPNSILNSVDIPFIRLWDHTKESRTCGLPNAKTLLPSNLESQHSDRIRDLSDPTVSHSGKNEMESDSEERIPFASSVSSFSSTLVYPQEWYGLLPMVMLQNERLLEENSMLRRILRDNGLEAPAELVAGGITKVDKVDLHHSTKS